MNEYIVGQLVETITLVLLGFCFLGIIASSLYSVWMTRQQKAVHIQTKRLRRNRPHVTILVHVQNSASGLLECLESIIKNRYRQYDIVVATHAHSNDTKRQLMRFKQLHPAARVYVYNQRKETSDYITLGRAYKRSQHGAIILTLRPDTAISKTFLKESVAHFRAVADVRHNVALRCNEQFPSPSRLTELLHYFPHASRQLMYKVASVLRLGRVSRGSDSFYSTMHKRIDFIRFTKGTTKGGRYVYDSTLVLRVLPGVVSLFHKKRSVKALLLFYSLAVTASLYVTYSLYMAMTLQNTALLLLGWVVVIVWFFVAIWSDDASNIPDKLRISFALSSLYFFLYLMVVGEVLINFSVRIYKSIRSMIRGTILFYASGPAAIE